MTRQLAFAVAISMATCAWCEPAKAANLPEPTLTDYYDRWLDSVSQWILEEERQAFRRLTDDRQRELFIRGFWRVRQPASDTTGSFLERWQQNFEEAQHRFENLREDRAQALIVAGKPARVVIFAGCNNVIRPLRLWSYGSWNAQPQNTDDSAQKDTDAYLVFYLETRDGPYRLWSPAEGTEPLMFKGPALDGAWSADRLINYAVTKKCFRWAPNDVSPFSTALRKASGLEDLRRLVVARPTDLSWLKNLEQGPTDQDPHGRDPDTLNPVTPDLPGQATSLPAKLQDFTFPGRYQRKTIVRGHVAIPIEEIGRNAQGFLFDRIVIVGEVRRGERLTDAFRVVHLIAGPQPAAPQITLDFYRRLYPATYSIDLRVENASGLGLARETRRLIVPGLDNEANPPPGHRLGIPGLTRREVGVLTTFPSIEILASDTELLVGDVEVAAVTTGGPIDRVEFRLADATAASDDSPPYSAVLAMASEPHPQPLEVVAFDPAGHEIARDTMILNASPVRFAVRLIEPQRGTPATRAKVEVDLPKDEVLDQVELYLNQQRIATWVEPPFIHRLPAPRAGETTYVRVVATLASGESAEDLVFVQSPNPFDEIDVQLVELYTSVFDDTGRFVTGLTAEDFQVREDNVPQRIRRFDTIENLAINVALLMDVSASMRKKLWIATRSAQRFFETVMTPKDRASLMTFNHDIRRIVPFTNGIDDLRYGVDGFRAWGTTRLYDSVIYALHSFGGLNGKRALVLLSDGQDVDSDFYFKQVLEFTLRSGVAVYSIALGVEDALTLGNLQRLAADSGGRFFQVAGVSALDRIYRQIEEELRSQYLLVYEPPTKTRRHEFRRVEIDVNRAGLRTRSIHGYYP